MKLFFLVFLILLLIFSCGPYNMDVSGTVKHVVEIDLSKLEKYFRTVCENEEPDNVDACVDRKTTEFLNLLLAG